MKKVYLLLTLMISSACFPASPHSLNTVDYVELDRYLGKWYEIARFDQEFQKGCTAVTAEYSMRKDGDIRVLNSCRLGSPDGKHKKSVGRAWVTNKKTNAKLKVQFFLSRFKIPFFSGNYWILDLDDDYQHVIVGDKSRKYLWILSRTQKMDDGLYTDLVNKAKDMHFNTENLIKTLH
jgi:apolipoprotein D and lipocalin family protein